MNKFKNKVIKQYQRQYTICMLKIFLYTLNREFHFGKKRLARFISAFNDEINTLSYNGQYIHLINRKLEEMGIYVDDEKSDPFCVIKR